MNNITGVRATSESVLARSLNHPLNMCNTTYTPYEGSKVANQMSRKLRVFDRKLEGSHSLFCTYFDKYWRK